ncbi:MAG: PAS domain-containing protein [Deltaproteobacteria bacterium]|nr:PAS domain-containing protein [Deltaproteobacteria bacterium]
MTLERYIIPSLSEGLFIFDTKGVLVRLNPSGERFVGRSEKYLFGRSAKEVFPGNTELCDLIAGVLKEGRPVTNRGVKLVSLEEHRFQLSVSLSPLQEPDGKVLGVVLLASDETLLSELSRSFRRADHLATIGSLNLGMAHEVKNPLGGIKGATQLLRSELGDDSPLLENCDIILREVERIDTLLENLLAAAPRKNAPLNLLNIHEVLDDVLRLIRRWEDAAHTTFTRDFDPSLPHILGNRGGLVQVFLNLIKNSVEASGGDGIITIRTLAPVAGTNNAAAGRRGGVLEVDILDHGPGFDPSIEDFAAPFFTTKPKGVGLGLAISEQIIQNHGGNLLLANMAGGGARVRVILPLPNSERNS